MPQNKWVWFAIGIAFALFVLPMVQGFMLSRKKPNGQ